MAIELIYCGEDEPTDECERTSYCRYHRGTLKPGDWDLVDYHYGPVGGGHPIRTTINT
jgi:hypothetical protein